MLLQINDLSVRYHQLPVVSGIQLRVEEKQTVVIVGESGSGKSTLLRSIIGLLGENGKIVAGDILFEMRSLPGLPEAEYRKLRGSGLSMIFQNPETFLDPRMRIQEQFYEAVSVHRPISRKQAYHQAAVLLAEMQLPDPPRILKSYPFELSGGMCQRIAIAMAMVNQPRLILADEPTSALDVTVQAEMIELMMRMQKQHSLSILLVTHNMLVVEKMADMVGVMYRGHLVEWGTKQEVLQHARHPYTQALLQAVPRLEKSDCDVAHPGPADVSRAGSDRDSFREAVHRDQMSGRTHFSSTHWIQED